jgi:hypothetical protein
VRFRAEPGTVMPYSAALRALVEYAWDNDVDYVAGPLDFSQMIETGIWVSGPDLEGVTDLLKGIPGLHQVEA